MSPGQRTGALGFKRTAKADRSAAPNNPPVTEESGESGSRTTLSRGAIRLPIGATRQHVDGGADATFSKMKSRRSCREIGLLFHAFSADFLSGTLRLGALAESRVAAIIRKPSIAGHMPVWSTVTAVVAACRTAIARDFRARANGRARGDAATTSRFSDAVAAIPGCPAACSGLAGRR
jgi:hypothetical protein